MKEVNLNDYFSADADVIILLDETDFESLCADYFYFEKVPVNTPIRFKYIQKNLMEEDTYWQGVFKIDEQGELFKVSLEGV